MCVCVRARARVCVCTVVVVVDLIVCTCVVGWTQAINTLGLCANPTEAQLRAEKPVLQRPTRGTQAKYARKGEEVVKVMVFKGADGKAAVIRAMTYDLLFNNMKSIVVKTASQ